MYPFRLLLVLAVVSSACEGSDRCNVVPKDLYIPVGSDVDIVCQTSCVSLPSKVFWTQDNRILNESLYKTINSSHTVLSLRDFTQPSATVQCHDAWQVLGGTTIKTYSKPNHLSCFSHYKKDTESSVPELFTCSWEDQTVSSKEVNYTVLCNSEKCPQRELCSTHQTNCTKGALDLLHDYSITVRAESSGWKAESDPFEFSPYQMLKVRQPAEVKIKPYLNQLNVTWRIPASMDKDIFDCEVKQSKADRAGIPEIRKTSAYGGRGNTTIDKLEFCTNYTFTIRCALVGAPWSEWSPVTTFMSRVKSLTGENLRPSLWRVVSERGMNGNRQVRAIWKRVPSACQGKISYIVEQTTPDGENAAAAPCDGSVCDVGPGAHVIVLRVYHDGVLLGEESVTVAADGEDLPEISNLQPLTGDDGIHLSWRPPAQTPIWYIVDYTHDGNRYDLKNTTRPDAHLSGLPEKTPYNITVTPVFHDKIGLGTKVTHICSSFGDPGNVFNIKVVPSADSALVSWEVKSQEACSGALVNSTVFFSTENEELHSEVDGTTRAHTLKNLKPGTQYRVFVLVTGQNGTARSEDRLFNTKRFDPRLGTVLIVFGSIFIVFVLSLGLCCTIQWKNFKEKPVPDPGHSSVMLWLTASDENRKTLTHPLFSDPVEGPCERVYTEDAPAASTSPDAADFDENPTDLHTQVYIVPDFAPEPDAEETTVAHVEALDPNSSGDSTAHLLSSESSPSSPYRRQSPIETSDPRPGKEAKYAPVEQLEKPQPVTVYISLDMLEQGQGR